MKKKQKKKSIHLKVIMHDRCNQKEKMKQKKKIEFKPEKQVDTGVRERLMRRK